MTRSVLIQRKAAKLAGYDVKHPPDELNFHQIKKLLVDGLADDAALLVEQFKDDVTDGLLMPCRKTGKGFNWPIPVGRMTEIIKTKVLTDDELLTVEAGGYPGVVITPWYRDGVTYPVTPKKSTWLYSRFDDDLNERMPRYEPPAAKVEYYFSRGAVWQWLANIDIEPSPVLLAWIGSEPPAKINTKKKPSKNLERDEDFKKWVDEDGVNLDELTKAKIHAILLKRNRRLWVSGFDDWWKIQTIYKAKPGRKRG